MSSLRTLSKTSVNAVAEMFGVRLVNAGWGPHGYVATLKRAKSRGYAPRTVLDIGASDGRWTRECRTVFPEAHYFLADPLPDNKAALRNLERSDRRVRVWTGAIGSAEGFMEIYCHGDQSSFLASREFSGPNRRVEVRTLDSFLASHSFEGPLLLKADVQGHEIEVLRGAARCLEITEMLLLEVSFQRFYDECPLAHEVITYAGQHGFCLYDICTYVQRASDRELIQADLAFARADSKLFAREGWA
jgi:FkbM family methyltransferase